MIYMIEDGLSYAEFSDFTTARMFLSCKGSPKAYILAFDGDYDLMDRT